MKVRPQHCIPASERGSALLVAMCFMLVLAVALASYQTACYYTLKLGSRSEQSVRSRQLAETGMEEALWALTNGNFTGWTLSSGIYTKTLTGFTYESSQVTGQVTVTIGDATHLYDGTNRSTTKPTIKSVAVIQNTDGTTATRTLSASTGYSSTATTGRAPILANALAANTTSGTVNLTSGGILVDSYDSSVGAYNSSTNSGYSAVVSGNAVTLANGTQVKGYVATAQTSSLSTGTTTKLTGPTTSASIKIDTARESTSPSQIAPDVAAPGGAGTQLAEPSGTTHLGTAGGATTTYYAILGGSSGWAGWYNLSSGTLQVDGPVILVVPGNLYINGSGSIVIKSGGSLQIFISGSTYIYYNGIDNQTLAPSKLTIIGTGTSYLGYTVGIWTPTKFYGTVYAPYDDITVWGYSSTSEIFGSLVGNNVTVYPYSSSSMPIHYDVSLRTTEFQAVGDTNVPFAVSSITDTTNSP